MSRNFLRLLALALLLAAAAGCGDSARDAYVEECSVNAGAEHCECLWEWFERNPGDRRDPQRLQRADAECLSKQDNAYVDACAASGRTRPLCRCVWRWFTRNVSREHAKELEAEAKRNPRFQSRELRNAERACR